MAREERLFMWISVDARGHSAGVSVFRGCATTLAEEPGSELV